MNQSLTSLVDDVFTLTNRHDLVGETTLAVRNATLKAHNQDFFYKDLVETGIVFDYEQVQQSLEYKTLVPRWRAFKYLRKYLQGTNGQQGFPGDFLEFISPDGVLDSYSINKENVCYLAGVELKIRSLGAQQHFLLGCYVFPNVTVADYKSWIAEEQPAAVIYEAAATVFKAIGYDEQNSAYRALVHEEYVQLKMNNIQAVGY
jgi:hypothetical protein